MATSTREEHQPLLGDPNTSENPSNYSEADNEPAPTRSEILRVAIPGVLIMVTFQIAASFIEVGLSALLESSVCLKEYPDLEDRYNDPRCKNDNVQAELSMVIALEQMFTIMPGFLTLIPYGILADKYGPKLILLLVFFGDVLAQGGEALVCAHPEILDIKWIYLCASMSVFGGGAMGQIAMQFAMAGTITTKQNRAIYFFYMTAISIVASFAGAPAAYLAMKAGGPVLTQGLGVAGLALSFVFSLALPNIKISKKAKQEESAATESTMPESLSTSSRIRQHISDYAKQASHMFRTLFWNNIQVGMLLGSIVFVTLGVWETAIRLQYATKRYGWSWGEAGLLGSVKSAVDLAMVAVVLPGLSTLLTQRYKLSAVAKDLWLARGTLTMMVIGSVLSGLAPTGTLFTIAVAIFELSKGSHPAVVSLIASLTEPEHHSLMYVCVAIMQSIGALASPPILSAVFSLGLKWGPSWYGLCFFAAAVLQLLSMIILYATREKKPEKDDSEE